MTKYLHRNDVHVERFEDGSVASATLEPAHLGPRLSVVPSPGGAHLQGMVGNTYFMR